MFIHIYNWGFKELDECFICCTHDGKTDIDKTIETSSNKTLCYPLLELSYVYGCNCKGFLAHNRCLLSIKKCPTCRKKPEKMNLYKYTKYDYYFKYYFDWIKKDAKRIKKTEKYVLTYLFFIFIPSLLLLEYLKENNIIIIPKCSIISFIFALLFGSFYCIGLILFGLNDYFVKYWLYNSTTETFSIF